MLWACAQAADSKPIGGTLRPIDALSEAQLLPGKSGEATSVIVAQSKRTARRAVSSLPSTVAELDYAVGSKARSARGIVRLVQQGTDSCLVVNLWALADTLHAAVDMSSGTLSIMPGKVYQHATYGPIWICFYDAATNSFSDKKAISGTIAQDGSIKLDGWGIFVVQGQYRGGAFARYQASDLKPTNAVMHDTILNVNNINDRSQTASYPIYIDSVAQNRVQIVNFANLGAIVNAYLGTDGTVEIAPQRVATITGYGDFYCQATDWTVKGLPAGSITAPGTDQGFAWGNWGLYSRAQFGTFARGYLGSSVTYNTKGLVTYPTALQLDWTGQGTQADPYVITTANQWLAMQQRVAAGNTFEGKYIALGADIDLSNLPLAYRPVGSKAHPFSGNFSGKGHSMSGLKFTTGEEDYQGLFGYASSTSTLSDVNLKNFFITTYGDYAGSLVGFAQGAVSNVTVTGTTMQQQGSMLGGVIGAFEGTTASNLSFDGTVTGFGETGGVIGQISGGTASQLQAHGTITTQGIMSTVYCGLGGIVGGTLGRNKPVLTDSYSDALVEDQGGFAYVGGVVGDLSRGRVERCFNVGPLSAKASRSLNVGTGNIDSYGCLGGIAGHAYGATVTDCFNANLLINAGNGVRVGGIVGWISQPLRSYTTGQPVKISNETRIYTSYNSGEVKTPTMQATQGLYGDVYSDTIFVNTYFDQQMTGNVMPDVTSPTIKLTAELTSGITPQGFSTSVWQCARGTYPELKSLAGHEQSKLAISPILLSNKENVRKVRTNFAVSSANGIKWQLFDQTAGTYADSTAGLAMKADSVVVKNINSSEVISARVTANPGQVKMVMLETVDPSAFRGSGTEADPFLISDKDDLMKLNDGIVNNAQSYEGDHFLQTNDIDLNYATDFMGVGTDNKAAHTFAGNYNGQGYSIHRLNLHAVTVQNGKAVPYKSKQNAGFFGIIGAAGVVRNLTIAADCDYYGYQNIGAIAGTCYGKIDSCRNYAAISAAASYTGGMVAVLQKGGSISHSYNAGAISSGSSSAGGIAATNYGTITACQNDGSISARADSLYPVTVHNGVGGIVAYQQATGVVESCVNTGTVMADDNTGGITNGASTGSQLLRNINYGVVLNAKPVGGNLGAMAAREWSADYTAQCNYYDAQLGYYGAAAAAPYPGFNGMLTRELTSGEAIDSLDNALLDYQAGKYPVLRQFRDEPAAQAHRAMVAMLPDAQTIDDVTTGAELASTAKWTLVGGKHFSLTTDSTLAVTISGVGSLRDTLVATIGAYTKALPLRAMAPGFKGSGTKDDPFQIANKDDMLQLARWTNEENYSFKGRYFKVMSDIDFDTTAYVPVAQRGHRFEANFDGQGHKFLNINYTNTEKLSLNQYMGLISSVGANANVHDVVLQSGRIAGYGRSGGIAGKVWGVVADCENHAVVTNTNDLGVGGIASRVMTGGQVLRCKNYSTFTGNTRTTVGGIAYDVLQGGLVKDCENFADLKFSLGYLGGIAAQSAGRIEGCENHGTVSGTSCIGGIVGTSNDGDTIIGCTNLGPVTASSSNAGGIVGNTVTKNTLPTLIKGCANQGTISSKDRAAGIVAYCYVPGLIDSCYNTADVTASGKYAGGLVGIQSGALTITNGYNTGLVSATGGYSGGLVGDSYGEKFLMADCYNKGDVISGGLYGTGITGALYGRVERCVNYGNVEATRDCGGITGYSKGSLSHCVNLGNVTSTGSSTSAGAGGLVALQMGGTIEDSYNLGDVTGTAYAGGLLAVIRTNGSTKTMMRRCYTAGAVKGAEGKTCNVGYFGTYGIEADSVLYDTDVNAGLTPASADALCTGLGTRQLVATQLLGSAFSLAEGCYPVLTEHADSALINWWAATVVLPEGSTASDVQGEFTVGHPAGTEWSASPDIVTFVGTKAYPSAMGQVTITKTLGDHSRSYVLNVSKTSGISDVTAGVQVVATSWFTLSGQQLRERPTAQGVYIERTTWTDGTTTAKKEFVK